MFEYKLQLGSLLLTLYFIVLYIKETSNDTISCNKVFDALMYTAPWAIVFDGITAWTVNHMDVVPAWINDVCHALFFILMLVVMMLMFVYMMKETIDIKSKKLWFLVYAPGSVSILSVIATMGKVYYIEGNRTCYSMGIPVYICFATLLFHLLVIFVVICLKYRNIEKSRVFNIFTFMILCLILLAIQIIFPEALTSSLLPTVTLVGIYMSFEDPAYRKLEKYNADMVTSFATLVENRDDNTGGHIRRTRNYVEVILNQMRKLPKYESRLSRDYIENVLNAAPMHDIGKISTPDSILQKPGKLTAEEYEIMKQHAACGGEIIKKTFANLGEPEYQQITYEVARYHHEKWNGRGYPEGLKETEIPLHARVMAIADVFDAVSAKRCYRDAMPLDMCFKIIEDGAGVDFDPDLVKIFLAAKEEIIEKYTEDKEEEIYNLWEKDVV